MAARAKKAGSAHKGRPSGITVAKITEHAATERVATPVASAIPTPPASQVESSPVEESRATVTLAGLHPAMLVFDRAFYAQANPDVVAADVDPATHYRTFGHRERRAPNPYFDPAAYVSVNPDLATFEGDLFLHYIFYGAAEGRRFR